MSTEKGQSKNCTGQSSTSKKDFIQGYCKRREKTKKKNQSKLNFAKTKERRVFNPWGKLVKMY